jgi:hypothetical protein
MKQDVSADPPDIGLLRPAAVVPCPERVADDFDQRRDASGRVRPLLD